MFEVSIDTLQVFLVKISQNWSQSMLEVLAGEEWKEGNLLLFALV
jgi:hypothetical protein